MTKLTPIEAKALQGILDSDFMDGDTDAQYVVNKPVWTWSANPFASKQTFSGAVSSLTKKGLVRSQDWGTRDAVIMLTQQGFDALMKWKATQ